MFDLFKKPNIKPKRSVFEHKREHNFSIYVIETYPMFIGYTRQNYINRFGQQKRDATKWRWLHLMKNWSHVFKEQPMTVLEAAIRTTRIINECDKKEKTRNKILPITEKKYEKLNPKN